MDGDSALDAWGRRLLRFARAGASAFETVSPAELQERLRDCPDGDRLAAEVRHADLREAADRAAGFLLEALGWKPDG